MLELSNPTGEEGLMNLRASAACEKLTYMLMNANFVDLLIAVDRVEIPRG